MVGGDSFVMRVRDFGVHLHGVGEERGQGRSMVAHWLSVTGDFGSNPGAVENFSSSVFVSQSYDCLLPSNKFMNMQCDRVHELLHHVDVQ